MRAGEIQCFQPGTDDVVAELLHYYRWPVGFSRQASRRALKKQLVRRPQQIGPFEVFRV
jgi:hypothetical protein